MHVELAAVKDVFILYLTSYRGLALETLCNSSDE